MKLGSLEVARKAAALREARMLVCADERAETPRVRCLGVVVLALFLALATGAANSGSERLSGRIVFTSKRDGDHELHVMRADGTGLRRLTPNRVDDTCPGPGPRRPADRVLTHALWRRRPLPDTRVRHRSPPRRL